MLRILGWDGGWAADLALLHRPDLAPARVVAVHRGRVIVRGEDIEAPATVAGALRHHVATDADLPIVGDWVAVSTDRVVHAVLPRRSALRRADEASGSEALVANVDVAIIVTSLNRDFNERRLERFLALARDGGAEPLVVLSKGDLATDLVADIRRVEGLTGGAPVLAVSALDGWGIGALRASVPPGVTAALLGTSGAGKSTLVNMLLGEERQRTLTIRASDDRGRHATTHRELFALPDGGLLVDTPGLRLPRLDGDGGLASTFADVEELAARCRFADCRHEQEPGCAVRAAIAAGDLAPKRLAALRTLEREARTVQERRAHARAVHREYRGHKGRRER